MRRLFLATFCVIALLTKADPGSAHEYSRYGTVESLVHRGTFQLDDSSFIGTVDKIYRNGHYYSHQPPLLATLEAPIYGVLQLPGVRFNNRGRFVMTYAFILLTNGLALALTVVVFAKILMLAGVANQRRDLMAVLLAGGTWLLPYGVISNNHGISALLVASLIWLLLQVAWQGFTTTRGALIGAALGLLSAIELLPLVSFVPATLVYLRTRRDVRAPGWIAVGATFIAPLLAHAALNIPITGDVIPAGFHAELFNYPGSVFDEASLTGSIKYSSLSAFGAYAWTALGGGKGFFTFAPLMLVGLIAGVSEWQWWGKARGVHLAILTSIFASLGASLLTSNNLGGEAVGFRHAAYLAPACVMLLLPWIVDGEGSRRRARAVIGVAAISMALMLVFAVRQPWSVLTWSSARVGTWDEYMPIVAKTLRGNLFNPD